jgi:hypothetical protein
MERYLVKNAGLASSKNFIGCAAPVSALLGSSRLKRVQIFSRIILDEDDRARGDFGVLVRTTVIFSRIILDEDARWGGSDLR